MVKPGWPGILPAGHGEFLRRVRPPVVPDPYLKGSVGKNFIDYTDAYSEKTTRVDISAITNGTGARHIC